MSNVRNISKNFIVLSLSQVLSTGLSLVLVILITRFIGDEGYGKLSFAISLAAILTILNPLGLDSLMTREVARHKDTASKYLGNILMIEILLSLLPFIFISIAVSAMQFPQDTITLIYIFGGYNIINIFSNVMRSIFRAYEKMEYIALLSLISNVIIVTASSIIILLGYNLVAIACIYLAAGIIDLLLTFYITFKHFVRPKIEMDFAFWRQIIPSAIPFAIIALIVTTYTQIDIIILRAIQDDATVGWYKAATALVYAFSGIPAILSTAIYPVMSRFHVSSKESLKLTIQKSARYLLILSVPITIGIMLLAEPIITIFYGVDFIPAVPALRVLAFYVPFCFLNIILGTMLYSVNKQKTRLYCYLFSTLARIALNILLIYKLSLTGAAVAIVASEVLLFALNYYFSAKYIPHLNIVPMIIKPTLAGICMGVLVYYLQYINLFLLIAIAAIVYFAIFIALRGFDADDRSMIKDIFHRNILK